MAKQAQNFDNIIQSLQDAQQNRELLDAMVMNLEKFVQNQRTVLNDLDVLIANAKSGNIPVKKRGGYRGRKNKPGAEPKGVE